MRSLWRLLTLSVQEAKVPSAAGLFTFIYMLRCLPLRVIIGYLSFSKCFVEQTQYLP